MQFGRLKRREFITLIGGAVAWPLAARAQLPITAFVWAGQTSSGGSMAPYVAAFRQGLREVGFVESQNVTVEYGWMVGEGGLPALMAELVLRQVAVIVGNIPPAMAAKKATSTIPIVFMSGSDPVERDLVASFNHPGGNATGISFLTTALEAKRLGLLRELLPRATMIATLVDPTFLTTASQLRELQDAARALRQEIQVVQASTESQLDSGFATIAQQRPDALIVAGVPFFTAQRQRIVDLVARHSVPTMYNLREFAVDGGLVSYGASLVDAHRQAGVYTGRILKGAKPADLPVVQSTKFVFVINLPTARALGLEVPPTLLARADEVIE
jgi:putative ABC transport system substrate-binding protein